MSIENNYLENLRTIEKILKIEENAENNCVEN